MSSLEQVVSTSLKETIDLEMSTPTAGRILAYLAFRLGGTGRRFRESRRREVCQCRAIWGLGGRERRSPTFILRHATIAPRSTLASASRRRTKRRRTIRTACSRDSRTCCSSQLGSFMTWLHPFPFPTASSFRFTTGHTATVPAGGCQLINVLSIGILL